MLLLLLVLAAAEECPEIFEASGPSLLQRRKSAEESITLPQEQVTRLEEEMSKLLDRLERLEDKEDSKDSKPVAPTVPVESPKGQKHIQEEDFEFCQKAKTNVLSEVGADVNHTDTSVVCDDKTEVPLFSPKDSSPYYEVQCCPADATYCAGCAKLNSGGTSCATCRWGYVMRSNKCVACVDLPWENSQGQNCHAASCSNSRQSGFSSNTACCKCGGGQGAATPFEYYVGPMAIGNSQVVGHPIPRTASQYAVDKDCEMAKFGLRIDPTTGKLERTAGCSTVGCGLVTSFEVKCTVTAMQADGLSASAPLVAVVGELGYGSGPVVLRGSNSAAPVTAPGLSGSFSLACSPEAQWLSVSSSGVLSLGSGSGGEVTDASGTTLGRGAVCSITKGTGKAQMPVLAPQKWNSMSYSYGGSTVLYATVGERSPALTVKPSGSGVPPTRFSADCAGDSFAFDQLSGVATYQGHEIFGLDVKSGTLQLQPEHSLVKALDSQSGVRRKISLSCTVFGHYEWQPAGQGPVLTHRLSLELRDGTCWASKVLSFASRVDKGSHALDACRALCRSDPFCSHFQVASKCYFYQAVCKDSSHHACSHKDVSVFEHYPGCGERSSCIDVKIPNFHYMSGKYCPRGENALTESQGPVYFKQGLTTKETFWLQKFATWRSRCSLGDWAIYKPHPAKDYENLTSSYVELHGAAVACLRGSTDLASDVFSSASVQLTVSQLTTGSATARVAAPGCAVPNITSEEEEEEEEKQSVFPLVLDDPSTDIADDHWLHPCQCVPASWGSQPPVKDESVADIPAGSNNEFLHLPFPIVEGEFVCEQENMLSVHVMSEDEMADSADCKSKCKAQSWPPCTFFWEGEVMSTKQCRLYSACSQLVREVGSMGILSGMTYRKACRIADPETCWSVTKRRSFLGAGTDSYPCLYEDLLQQCDHKLMLGGFGVAGCGKCQYAPVQGRNILSYNGKCLTYANDKNVYATTCSTNKNQKWFFEGEAIKTDVNDDCLDYNPSTGNVYMHSCHGSNNQLWYFEGAHLKSRHDGKCLDLTHGNGNAFVGNCPGSNTMHWAWKQDMHDGQKLISDNGLCLKHESDNTFKATGCSKAFAHRFYFVGELLKSEKDSSMCVEHVSSTGEVRASTCQSGNNFKWYWDGQFLKSRTDGRCLDFLTHSGLARVGSCPNSNTQRWNQHSVSKALPAAKLTSMHSAGHCWDWHPETNDVYMHDICHGSNHQKWYLDGESIKSPHDTSKCLDEDSGGNLYMHPCHGGDNQRFYWDGHRIKNKKWNNAKCVDYNYGNGNLYMHTCHSGANQRFNFWTPQRLSSEADPSKCMEKQGDNNVVMHNCKHDDNQQWFFQGPILRNQADALQCLDMHTNSDSNLYMHSCHGGDNQAFFWSGELVKSVHDNNLCWKMHGVNVEGKPCDSSSDFFKWYFHAPIEKGKLFKSDYEDSCMDWDENSATAYMNSNCHKSSNQRWYFSSEEIHVESRGDSACLDYDPSTARVYMHTCHGGNNQKWYFDGKLLRSRNDARCLDFNTHGKKMYVISCPDSNTLKWTAGTDIHNSVQLISDGNKCLSYDTSSGDKNVEASGCSESDNKLWYFDSSDRLKTEQDDMCIDYHPTSSNYYMHGCHSGQNQKFYWDGKHLRDKHDDYCMDYHVANGNVRAGTCQDKQNDQWTLEGGAMLKKTPIPTTFSHGQTLEVSCWSERFSSTGSDKLSCVAGSWVNSRGSLGLEGFSCKACVQVVSPKYADLDSQIRQELFFAAGLKLHLTVDTRTVRSVTAAGGLRTGGTTDVFVAELMDGAGETLRRFRSITSSGQCLAEVGGSLRAEACASEAEPAQLMEVTELSSLLWEEYKASADVPGSQSSYLANRGSAPTTLRSFQVQVDCGYHALTSLGFNHGMQLGMSGACTAASTYGALVEAPAVDVPGHVTITSASHGTCLSINHIIPWKITSAHNSKCLDYNYNTENVYAFSCHGGDNQQWYMVNGNMYSLHNGKCLDYHTGTNNVYMHDCHDGSNQKWYFDEDTKAIRSEYDHRCLDVHLAVGQSDNVYMHECHEGANQQFDRHETASKAIELALHMPCSGSAAEEIKVEPIGSHQKFRLKSQGYTLHGEYKFSSNKKIERVDVSNKCMEADNKLSGVKQETCVDSLEQEWVIGHGLQGLADAPIACVGNQVISYIQKTSSQIRYKCVHVSSLGMCSPGYSEQVDTKALELEDVKALRLMTATCPVGHGLRSLMAEASDKGAWIRLRYECCQISRVPVTVYPYLLSSELRDFDTGMAGAWEGVYCPTSLDSSGRMQFSQSRSFKPGQNPSGTLTYDKFQGQWCVTGKTCAASDIVHPLDSPLQGSEWRVVPVSDFDAQFEARGVKPIGGRRKRKPPPLIKFGATDPEYLPECKDESHPGTRKFKLEIMNSEAESLDDENPCKYVFGKSPSDKSLEDAQGMTGWKDDLKGNTGAGVGGVTYKSVKECADREITRELKMANWAEDHFNKTNGLDFLRDFFSGIGDIFPAAEAAPLGAGFEFHPGALIYLIGHMAINGAEMGLNRQLQNREMKYEEVGHDDCNSIQHGFARTFCDLHCIRDAVRKGNDAILRAMEEAVEVIGKNTQILLEHYVGESSGSGLLQEGKKIQEGIQHHVAELAELASSALEPKASLLAQRALSSFTQRWGSDQGSNSSGLLQEVRDLHSTLTLLSQRKISQTEEVQQRALEMASHMGSFLEVKAHMLGVYRQRAHAGKFIQRWLRTNFRQVTASDVLSEMEEQAAERAMEEFDTMWWEIRQELDTYLQASQDYVDATNSAVQMLHSYTSECQAGFSALKQSYALSARAEKKAHEALKKTWSTVSVRMGAMASKVMDGALLERLATHDIQHIDVGSLMASHHQPCSSDALGVVETAVKVAMKKGVFGQTYWQLKELLEEMAMLQQRFAVHGQNAPDASTLTEAAARFTQATKQTTSARERLARKMLAHWQQGAC